MNAHTDLYQFPGWDHPPKAFDSQISGRALYSIKGISYRIPPANNHPSVII